VPQQNASPVRQMLCKITANLRASATRALFVPDRLAIFIAQILRPKGRLTRVMMTVAASYRQRRASATLRYVSAAVDIARLILSGGESQVRALACRRSRKTSNIAKLPDCSEPYDASAASRADK
jgi:hypothetical protein